MKRLVLAVFCLFALFLMTAPTAVEKSRDIYVNGKFLITSYSVGGQQVVAFEDLTKLVAGAGNLTINGGKVVTHKPIAKAGVMGQPPQGARTGAALKIKNAVALGNVISSNGRQWLAVSDLLKQVGGMQEVPTDRLAAGAAIQLRVFDCPDVHCCPDCGIGVRF
jgi:hypothetical protein